MTSLKTRKSARQQHKGDTQYRCNQKCRKIELFWMFQGYPDVRAWPHEELGSRADADSYFIVRSNLVNGLPVGYKPALFPDLDSGRNP